jgi:polysaccharide pyruvyl transferase WcaK-like protein
VAPWQHVGVSRVSVRGIAGAVRRRARDVHRFDPRRYLPPPTRARGGPPRVGLVGFFGWGNYGDELFIEVFREHLGGRLELQPIFDSVTPPYTTAPLREVVDATDAVLIGGGDIVSPWSRRSRYWAGEFLRRPAFVAGVGVPTWRPADPGAVREVRRFFRHANVRFIHARDEESGRWIETHLEPRIPVVTAPDLVCALTLPPVARPSDPPILGIVVRKRDQPDDLTHVRRLAERGAELGYRVRTIVLATGSTRPDDLEATRALGFAGAELVESDGLQDLTRAIGECTVLATMKFHGLVVATMYGIPAFALIRTDKNINFLRRIGRLDLVSGVDDPELADHLTRDVPPIDPRIPGELRRATEAMLTDLAARLAAV